MSFDSPFFRRRILFLKIESRNTYSGPESDDIDCGGHEDKHEIFNFKPFNGIVYGFARTSGPSRGGSLSSIHIERIGARKKDPSVDDTLVVWLSKHRSTGETVIVGWYESATVYRHMQTQPTHAERRCHGAPIGYFVKANAAGATCVPVDSRGFVVAPRSKPTVGLPHRNGPWYADEIGNQLHHEIRAKTLEYIAKYAESVAF